MSKFTPGPWVINRDESTNSCDSEKLSIEGGALYIAQVDHCMHQEANANLISAAPDLLDALIKLVDFYQHGGGSPEEHDIQAEAYAAIAKVRGES